MARARTWKCSCGMRWAGTKRKCDCGKMRPKRRVPKHQLVLELMPYDDWVAQFGEVCGICGRPPGPTRKLDRDHCHTTGMPRGLLCHRCNRALPDWMTIDWLLRAAAYLRRDQCRSR